MRFHNREHAAHLLAKQLTVYRGRHQGVLGIPRGAVPMAKIIADALEGDLDVVLVHKLGAPGNPELAVGAVDETGHLYLNEVVDNGIATGASMIAALRAVRAKRPAKLIAAVAVAPAETVARMWAEADEVMCLYAPDHLYAVGQFSADFSPVSDEQVIAILRQSGTPPVPEA